MVDFFQTVDDCTSFQGGEMQGFVLRIVEKCVLLDFLAKIGSVNQVWMKQYAIYLGTDFFVFHFNFYNLSGGKTYDCSFLIVVVLPAIFQRTVDSVFQI